jgi:hypothetical protein
VNKRERHRMNKQQGRARERLEQLLVAYSSSKNILKREEIKEKINRVADELQLRRINPL